MYTGGNPHSHYRHQTAVLHDSDNVFLPVRRTSCLPRSGSTVCSVDFHSRGFLCAEAAPFVLALRLSAALMSSGGRKEEEKGEKKYTEQGKKLAGRCREHWAPAECKMSGIDGWRGIERRTPCQGRRAALLRCHSRAAPLCNSAGALCSHESCHHRLSRPRHVQVLICQSGSSDANGKATRILPPPALQSNRRPPT